MKILRVINSTSPLIGGPVSGIAAINSSLEELGATVEIVCGDRADSSWLNDPNMPIIHAIGRGENGYGYVPGLIDWLRENAVRFDAVIVHGLWQYSGLATHCALARSKIPYFVFTHGMLDPWFKHTYPLKHLKKWLYWPWAEYRVLRDARAVIFTSEEERVQARKSFWLYRANEVVTNYGTSTPPGNRQELEQRFLNSHPHLQGKRIVLFLSRIHEKKGCDLLLDAFAQVATKDDRLHLLMAGPDQVGSLAELQAQSKRLGIADKVTWPGMLQGDAKWGAFYVSEVFCLPSHQENFGIVVAEALACGKPVLISNKVNIWREIDQDGAGFVANDDLSGTVQNLERWLKLESPDYLAMSARALKCFNGRFRIQRAAERLVEIISEYIK